jgi:hypothetical protein
MHAHVGEYNSAQFSDDFDTGPTIVSRMPAAMAIHQLGCEAATTHLPAAVATEEDHAQAWTVQPGI